jgi:hypothetical protein
MNAPPLPKMTLKPFAVSRPTLTIGRRTAAT